MKLGVYASLPESLQRINPQLAPKAPGRPRAKRTPPPEPSVSSLSAAGIATITVRNFLFVSESNARGEWSRHKRKKRLRSLLALARPKMPPGPWLVTFTRFGRTADGLDDDNLPPAFKTARDVIAERLAPKRTRTGRIVGDDGPRGPCRWAYTQERAERADYGATITIATRSP